MSKDYAVYEGDTFICWGTAKDCAERIGISPETIYFYATEKYRNRLAKRTKGNQNPLIVIRIEDD